MNTINKKLLIFLMTIMFCQFQLINLKAADDTTIIDDEELPAIDPFSSGSSVTNQVTETDSQMTSNNGLLNNMRLVGMIIGENNRPQDLELNICKAKQLTNMRSAGADELDQLQSPIEMTLERALEYIGPGEMLEVTPESIRLRKVDSKKNLKK